MSFFYLRSPLNGPPGLIGPFTTRERAQWHMDRDRLAMHASEGTSFQLIEPETIRHGALRIINEQTLTEINKTIAYAKEQTGDEGTFTHWLAYLDGYGEPGRYRVEISASMSDLPKHSFNVAWIDRAKGTVWMIGGLVCHDGKEWSVHT